MVSRGYLIRFIDIGLIVMFGFIQISDIESLAQVELAAARTGPAAADPADAPRARLVVVVGIAPDGRFSVSEAASGTVLARELATSALLSATLRSARDSRAGERREVVVIIRPHEASVVQRTVDVMDVCDRLGLRLSLETELVIEGRR